MLRREIDRVKQTVSMADILTRYGMEANRHGYISCPFHTEKTASCRIYEKSFYCFGCGAGGDVIDFVRRMENLDLIHAIQRLGGLEDMKFSERRRLMEQERKQKETQRAEEARQREYWQVWDEWIRLDQNFRSYRPVDPDEQPHPLFLEALEKLETQSYRIDCLNVW